MHGRWRLVNPGGETGEALGKVPMETKHRIGLPECHLEVDLCHEALERERHMVGVGHFKLDDNALILSLELTDARMNGALGIVASRHRRTVHLLVQYACNMTRDVHHAYITNANRSMQKINQNNKNK